MIDISDESDENIVKEYLTDKYYFFRSIANIETVYVDKSNILPSYYLYLFESLNNCHI